MEIYNAKTLQMMKFTEWSEQNKFDQKHVQMSAIMGNPPPAKKTTKKVTQEMDDVVEVEILDISKPLAVVMFGDNVKKRAAGVIDRMMLTAETNDDSFTIIDQVKNAFSMMNGIKFKQLPEKDTYLSRIFQFVKTREELRNEYVAQYNMANREFNNINSKMGVVRDRIVNSINDLKKLMDDNIACLSEISEKENVVKATLDECGEQHPMSHKLQDKLDSFNILKISIHQTNTQLDLIVKNHMTIIEKINDISNMVFPIWKRQFFVMNTLLEQKEFTDATRLQVDTFEKDQQELNNIMSKILKK